MCVQGTVLDAGETKANKMDTVFITELTVYGGIPTTIQWAGLGQEKLRDISALRA